MNDKTVISGAGSSAKGDRVLVNASLGLGQSFQCRETKAGTLEMGLCLNVTRDGLMLIGDAVTKAVNEHLKRGWTKGVQGQKREEVVQALQGLKNSIASGQPDSVFDSATRLERMRANAALHGPVLEEALSSECSFAMVDALDMLRAKW